MGMTMRLVGVIWASDCNNSHLQRAADQGAPEAHYMLGT